MTSFTFSLEQLKAAPPEVRRWVEHEIGVALGALSRFDHDPSQTHSAALAACTPEEALQVFEAIKGNFLLSQVFFELARETPAGRAAPPLHAVNIAELLRHTRLSDGDQLADCLTAINQVFRTVRNDPEAALFGLPVRPRLYSRVNPPKRTQGVGAAVHHRPVCREPAGAARHDIAASRTE